MAEDRDDKSVAAETWGPPARRPHAVLLLAALAAAPFATQAQVYKCAQANGTTSYQSTPCPASGKPSAHPTATQLNAQRTVSKDDKPYDDPYANSVESRPHPQAPSFQVPASPNDAAPAPAPAQKTSNLVAEVQARNRRENEQQAVQDAHRNDKRVDMANCNSARRNLGVLSEQRPVFSYDNKGNRVYVEDKDRASRIAEAQRAVAASCP